MHGQAIDAAEDRLAAREAAIVNQSWSHTAERLLTLVGIPLLMAALGAMGSTLLGELARGEGARREIALLQQRAATLEARLKEESDASRLTVREMAARLDAERTAIRAQQESRDGAQDRQISEISAGLTSGRESMVRLGAQMDGVRADLAELKAILTRRDRAEGGEIAPLAGASRPGRPYGN